MSKEIHVIGLTGGIATGKSTCCRLLCEMLPELVLFDADASVAGLYQNPEVVAEIAAHFGSSVVAGDGMIDRRTLGRLVFADAEARLFLEQLFHPLVKKECLALLAETTKKGASRLFVADIPLLFEGGFDFGQSANLLVATSRTTQVSRLKSRNTWDADTVNGVIRSQMPIEAKLKLADVVFWNEGPVEILASECHRYLVSLGLISNS